ncbi:MAG: peptide deformylase [Legionellales bacterium]|nr:peptide deformylase [Legionellales bacterium]
MAIKTPLKMGNPLLYQISKPLTVDQFNSKKLAALITDLQDTMAHYQGAGIAAPQIGVLKRVIVFGFEQNPRYPKAEPVPKTILINPQFEILSQDTEDMWEGCLSVPGLRGVVKRFNQIRYWGFNTDGQKIERCATGFHAKVIQHECDHLDGILFPQRLTDLGQFGFESELTDVLSL